MIDRKNSSYEMGPPSPRPDIGKMDHEAAVEAMVKWFWENFEDPVENTPWDSEEGGYQYIWGGPCDAREELEDAFMEEPARVFMNEAIERAIAEAVNEVEQEGYEWVPSQSRMRPEGAEDGSAN
jgi:hypothetical protein